MQAAVGVHSTACGRILNMFVHSCCDASGVHGWSSYSGFQSLCPCIPLACRTKQAWAVPAPEFDDMLHKHMGLSATALAP